MGGSILRWRDEGLRVGVADLTRGETGTKGDPETRRREADAATRILGLDYRVNLDLGDARLADSDDNRLAVIETIRKTKPRALFTTAWFDRQSRSRCRQQTRPVGPVPGEIAEDTNRLVRAWRQRSLSLFDPRSPIANLRN